MDRNLREFLFEYDSQLYVKITHSNYQRGGSLDQLNDILSNYNTYNVKVDSYDVSEARIYFYTIDNKNTCMILILDYERKYATIGDLCEWPNCMIDQDRNVIKMLIEFSTEIAKQSNMTHIELCDRSYYTCDSALTKDAPGIFQLDMANTVTNELPYYYKYGFIYKQEQRC